MWNKDIIPGGNNSSTSMMKATSVHPEVLPHTSSHFSGSTQATSLGKRTLAAIPGNTNNHSGRNLMKAAITQPALA